MSADYHVVAWNYVDEQGEPIIEIDRDMTRAEFRELVTGKYRAVSCSLLRPVSREAIDRALEGQDESP